MTHIGSTAPASINLKRALKLASLGLLLVIPTLAATAHPSVPRQLLRHPSEAR
jgi:hypothetical protein